MKIFWYEYPGVTETGVISATGGESYYGIGGTKKKKILVKGWFKDSSTAVKACTAMEKQFQHEKPWTALICVPPGEVFRWCDYISDGIPADLIDFIKH